MMPCHPTDAACQTKTGQREDRCSGMWRVFLRDLGVFEIVLGGRWDYLYGVNGASVVDVEVDEEVGARACAGVADVAGVGAVGVVGVVGVAGVRWVGMTVLGTSQPSVASPLKDEMNLNSVN